MENSVYTNDMCELSAMGKKQFNFRLDDQLMKDAKRLADQDNRTLTNYVETIISETVKASKKKKKNDVGL